MADTALDAESLRGDRQRYAALLEQAEQQIAAWNERADHLQQAIDGLDRLLALTTNDPALDGGVARSRTPVREVAPAPAAGPQAADPAPEQPSAEPARPARAPKRAAARRTAPKKPPAPTSTPAAPEPVEPPAASAADAPKGTDALRLMFESDPGRTWSLAELIDGLGAKGWLPTSRRPEEGVRISLKRLAERGGVLRTDDGQWRLADGNDPLAADSLAWPEAEPPPAPSAPAADAAPVAESPPAEPPQVVPPPLPPPAPVGRPVGGTVTEL